MANYQFSTFARTPGIGGLILFVLFLCAACQPSLDERLASAREYIASGDYRAANIELKNILRETPADAEARSLLAHTFYQMADFPTAAVEFERSLGLGGDSTTNWLGLGEALLRGGDAAEVLDRVMPMLDLGGTDERQIALAANTFVALGNHNEAAILFEKLLELDSTSEPGLIGMATIARSRGDSARAEDLLARAASSADATSRVYLLQGYNARMRGDMGAAIKALESAISHEQANTNLADQFDVRVALATTLIDREEFTRARKILDDLGRYFPGHPFHHYLRGQLAFAEGDLDRASLELQKYLSRAPNDLGANVAIGAVSFYQNFYSQAEMYLQRAVRQNVGGDSAVRLLAETRLRLDKPQEALELLRGAGIDGDDASMLGLLGRAEFRSGNRDAGLTYLQQGVAADPDSPEIRLMYSMALIADGQNEKAVAELELIDGLVDPNHRKEVLLLLAMDRQGNRELAIDTARNFLAANKRDSGAHALVGSFMQSIGDAEQAANYFELALGMDASNNMALLGMARLALESREDERAEKYLHRILGDDPANMPALVILAGILLPAKRYDELATFLDSAVEAAPNFPGPRILQTRVLLHLNRARSALAIVRKARDAFPNVADFLNLEGIALIEAGQIESALISLARAAEAEPDNERFQFDLAVASLHVRDYRGAIDAIAQYRRVNSQDPTGLSVQVSAHIGLRKYSEAHALIDAFEFADENRAIGNVLRGDIFLEQGLADDAVTEFEIASESVWNRGVALRLTSAYLAAGSAMASQPLVRWLAEHPDDAAIRRSYGELLQLSGSKSEAVEQYEAALAVNANDAVALNNLAWEYAISGKLEALNLARRAYELEPEQPNIIDTYAWILFLNDDPVGALRLLRKAARMAPSNGDIAYHLAKVLAEIGEREEAARMINLLLMSNHEFASRAEAVALAESLQ